MALCGMSKSICLRLWTRAPRTSMASVSAAMPRGAVVSAVLSSGNGALWTRLSSVAEPPIIRHSGFLVLAFRPLYFFPYTSLNSHGNQALDRSQLNAHATVVTGSCVYLVRREHAMAATV